MNPPKLIQVFGKDVNIAVVNTLKNDDGEYIKNSENNWSNGFIHLTVKSNGNFQVMVHEIWGSELVVDNRVLK